MPEGYNVGEVCLNGHEIIGWVDKAPESHEEYCARCGAKTIQACPDCDAPIRGTLKAGISVNWTAPAYCIGCGRPFPWTRAKLEAAQEAVDLLEGLSDDERAALRADLMEIGRDSPKSEVAATRAKLLMKKAGGAGVGVLVKMATEIATDAAKKVLLGG